MKLYLSMLMVLFPAFLISMETEQCDQNKKPKHTQPGYVTSLDDDGVPNETWVNLHQIIEANEMPFTHLKLLLHTLVNNHVASNNEMDRAKIDLACGNKEGFLTHIRLCRQYALATAHLAGAVPQSVELTDLIKNLDSILEKQ